MAGQGDRWSDGDADVTDADLDLATRSIIASWQLGGIDAAKVRLRQELRWFALKMLAAKAIAEAGDGPDLTLIDLGD
jgi:hypothetical protein